MVGERHVRETKIIRSRFLKISMEDIGIIEDLNKVDQ